MATKDCDTSLENMSRLRISSATLKNGCCSFLYVHRPNLKIFRNKGAILVLILSFCGFSVFHFLIDEKYNDDKFSVYRKISPIVIVTMSLLFYPAVAWLTDVYCERHKVIMWSLRILLVALINFCLISSFLDSLPPLAKFLSHIPITLGLAGFSANIVQFGVDQLVDASSVEISSFTRWIGWAWCLSSIVVHFSSNCLCSSQKAIAYLLLPTLIALAICLDIFCNHWLVKEKTSRNPFSLIFKVLRYAAKNKYPRLRNAFSYWDDRQYSRIDLAKTRFGGPYTTEQVEDVKTFFRITPIIIFGAFFIGLYIAMYPVYGKLLYRLNHTEYGVQEVKDDYSEFHGPCLRQSAIVYFGSVIVAICIPLFELVLYPFFKRYDRMSILQKIVMGLVLLFLSLTSCAVIEFAARSKINSATTDTCPFNTTIAPHSSALNLDYKWMAISYALSDFAQYIFATSVVEFLCAQAPFAMQGYIFGLTYGSLGFFVIVGYFIQLLLQSVVEKRLISSNRYGCVFWYLVISLGILVSILVLAFVVIKCYKRRSRKGNANGGDEE